MILYFRVAIKGRLHCLFGLNKIQNLVHCTHNRPICYLSETNLGTTKLMFQCNIALYR